MKTLIPTRVSSLLAFASDSLRASRRKFTAMLAGLVSFGLAASAAPGSGRVLPPEATPLGYSLTDMAAEVANFSISGNDPAFFPDTPFQLIYGPNGNTFTVSPGTFFYVKFFFIDDAEPVIGDFPADESEVEEYMFGSAQLGADFELVVDGRVTSLSEVGYVGGPVPTPDSPDGSDYLLQVGAFISPLAKGTHTVTIRGTLTGDAFVDFVGGPFATSRTYTVIVE